MFSATNYVVNSSDGTATVTVLRTNGTYGSVSVAYATVQGTALPGVHYQTASGTLSFNNGDTSKTFTIPLIYNNNAQPAVNLSVVLSDPQDGAGLADPTNAMVTILNTNTVFYFAAATNNAPENSGFVTVTVLRNNTNGAPGVSYATADGTAVHDVNYIAESGTLTFSNGATSESFIVPLIYDMSVTGDKQFRVSLSSPSDGTYLTTPSTNTVVVQDADAGLSFTNATMSVLKSATNAVITVVCGNPRVDPVTVQYYTVDGTATNGIDYVGTNGTLVFTNGLATNTFAVPILNNGLLEGNRDFSVVLTNAAWPGQLVSPSNQVVTIIDNPWMSFSSPAYTVVKNGVQALISVYRTGYTDSVVSVDFATTNGTAFNGIDYIGTNGTLVLTNGVTNGTFAVPVIFHVGVQPPKTVLLSIANPTNCALAAPSNSVLTILDSTNPVIAFALATNAAPENSGYATIEVLRLNNTNGEMTVQFGTTNGTAQAGLNYTATNGILTFTNGQTVQNIQVPLIYNPVVSGDLAFTIGLSNPTGGAQLIAPSLTTVVVQDADAGLSFTNTTMSVLKNGTNAVVSVVCSNPRVEPVTVQYYTVDGTATNGVHYFGTNGTLVFAGGVTTNTIIVPITNNNILDISRTFSVALTNATWPGQLVSPSNIVVTILDSNPGISFSSPTYAVVKNGVQAIINVYRTGYTDSVMSVDYATTNGTAIVGQDYLRAAGTLVFTNGVTNESFAVTIINHLGVQPDKTVLLNLLNPTNAVLTPPTNATLTIYDSTAGLAFAAVTNTVLETAGSVAVNVIRSGNAGTVVTVNYATFNETAVSGVNYLGVTNSLTFGIGETLRAITIPLIHDPQVTGDLMFGVHLSNPGGGAQLLNPVSTTVVVQDADAGLSFDTASSSVLKNAGSAVINVVCSNPNAEPVSVNYSTADGTATAGSDYTATSGTLTFTNGIVTNSFVVPIINNGLVTGNRSFSVSLSSPTAPAQLTSPTVETVTIIDSNSGLSFSNPAYSVLKNGVAATITVIRTGNTDNVASVNYLATNGTAVAGVNFTAVSGTLTFTNGVTSQTFTVPIIDTTVVQPDLTVLLVLSSPANAILQPPNAAILTIHDTSGSYVVPAGAAIDSETGAGTPNGIINPGETVRVLFAFRDAGGTNVANLLAILLATNGVTPASPTTNSYGPLIYGGHSVFRPFTFTASGTNGQQIQANFNLQDGIKPIGSAVFAFTLGSWTNTFANSARITINDNTTATPYPSLINVSGVGSTLVKATVTITNLSHQSPIDIGALVASPSQQTTLLMGYAGGTHAISHIGVKFDDAATNSLPYNAVITNGVYKPTSYGTPNFP